MARENLAQKDLTASKLAKREDEEIFRLEKAAVRLREWGIGNAGLAKRGIAIQSRADRIKNNKTESFIEKRRDIALHYDSVRSNSIIDISPTTIKDPNGQALFSLQNLKINKGDRIAVLGLNGTGKSVFLRTILDEAEKANEDPAYTGPFKFSPQIKIGYLDQHLEAMPEHQSIQEYVSDTFSLDRTKTTRELVNAGFPANMLHKKIGDLSFGERSRLALLGLKLSQPNFYILDEPTNHLDIEGQESLEEALDIDGQACLFISHDRKMLKGVPNRYWEIRNNRLIEVDSPQEFFEQIKNAPESVANQAQRNKKELNRGFSID